MLEKDRKLTKIGMVDSCINVFLKLTDSKDNL